LRRKASAEVSRCCSRSRCSRFSCCLLVGLATFARIELAVAGNGQRQEQARQNALFALNVALGQLQKYAGPDTRVTATGDAGVGCGGARHYTGVWDATTGPTPLTWLLSGNETTPRAVSLPAQSMPE